MLEIQSDTNVLLQKAKSLQLAARHAESLICFDQVLGEMPQNKDALYHKAKSLVLLGKIPDSLKTLREAVSYDYAYKNMAKTDPAFVRLELNPEFREITG
jgi:tetratricopeptide (TPR) repeat protein